MQCNIRTNVMLPLNYKYEIKTTEVAIAITV
jgi:hypothetical protein